MMLHNKGQASQICVPFTVKCRGNTAQIEFLCILPAPTLVYGSASFALLDLGNLSL